MSRRRVTGCRHQQLELLLANAGGCDVRDITRVLQPSRRVMRQIRDDIRGSLQQSERVATSLSMVQVNWALALPGQGLGREVSHGGAVMAVTRT